jgi:hypothetical protein
MRPRHSRGGAVLSLTGASSLGPGSVGVDYPQTQGSLAIERPKGLGPIWRRLLSAGNPRSAWSSHSREAALAVAGNRGRRSHHGRERINTSPRRVQADFCGSCYIGDATMYKRRVGRRR